MSDRGWPVGTEGTPPRDEVGTDGLGHSERASSPVGRRCTVSEQKGGGRAESWGRGVLLQHKGGGHSF